MYKILKWTLVLIIGLSLGLFIYQTDFDAILQNLKLVGFGFFWLIVVTFLAQIFGTLTWVYTLPRGVNIPFRKLFVIRYIGEHIGLVNPANVIGGDAFKAYQLEKEGLSYSDGLTSLLISRFIMIYTQVGLFLISALLYLFFVGDGAALLFNAIGITVVFLIVTLGLLILSDRFLISLLSKGKEWSAKIDEIRQSVWIYYREEKQRCYLAVFWSLVNFIVGAMEIWLICFYIGFEITILEAVLIDQGALFLKSFAAFIPGQIGVEEYTNKVMLEIVGITSLTVWVSVSILRRARQLFWIILGVGVYYLWFSRNQNSVEPVKIKSRD